MTDRDSNNNRFRSVFLLLADVETDELGLVDGTSVVVSSSTPSPSVIFAMQVFAVYDDIHTDFDGIWVTTIKIEFKWISA